MKLAVLFLLFSGSRTEISIKKEVRLCSGYISLVDVIETDNMSKQDLDTLKSIYLGKADSAGMELSAERIRFELKYSGLNRFDVKGEKVALVTMDCVEKPILQVIKPTTMVRAKKTIRKNHILRESDLELVTGQEISGSIDSVSLVVGMKAVRDIKSGEFVTTEMIKMRPVIRKGGSIHVKGKFVEVEATTLDSAAIGDVIQCVIKGVKDPVDVKVIDNNNAVIIEGGNNVEVK